MPSEDRAAPCRVVSTVRAGCPSSSLTGAREELRSPRRGKRRIARGCEAMRDGGVLAVAVAEAPRDVSQQAGRPPARPARRSPAPCPTSHPTRPSRLRGSRDGEPGAAPAPCARSAAPALAVPRRRLRRRSRARADAGAQAPPLGSAPARSRRPCPEAARSTRHACAP